MAGVVVWIVLFTVIMVLRAARASGVRSYDTLQVTGVPARGVLLAVAPTGMKVTYGFRAFAQRQVTIDVEVPGRPPYVVSTTVNIPTNFLRDVLPGVTVELRVDPASPRNVAIVGPAVGMPPPLVAQPPGPQAMMAPPPPQLR